MPKSEKRVRAATSKRWRLKFKLSSVRGTCCAPAQLRYFSFFFLFSPNTCKMQTLKLTTIVVDFEIQTLLGLLKWARNLIFVSFGWLLKMQIIYRTAFSERTHLDLEVRTDFSWFGSADLWSRSSTLTDTHRHSPTAKGKILPTNITLSKKNLFWSPL